MGFLFFLVCLFCGGRILEDEMLSLVALKVGIPELLSGVGKGVERHMEKLDSELGDLRDSP